MIVRLVTRQNSKDSRKRENINIRDWKINKFLKKETEEQLIFQFFLREGRYFPVFITLHE